MAEADLKEWLLRIRQDHENSLSFPKLSFDDKVSLAKNVAECSKVPEVLRDGIVVIKILARDAENTNALAADERMVDILATVAGYLKASDTTCRESCAKECQLEARKALCNFSFNSSRCREILVSKDDLPASLTVQACELSEGDYQLFAFKLLFILTAFNEDYRRCVAEKHGAEILGFYKPVLDKQSLTEKELVILIDALKVLFNLCLVGAKEDKPGSSDVPGFSEALNVIPSLHGFIRRMEFEHFASPKCDVLSQIVNVLTNCPPEALSGLVPKLEGDSPEVDTHGVGLPEKYHVFDFYVLHLFVMYLLHMLDVLEKDADRREKDSLHPILVVLSNFAFGCRVARKWLRFAVLPPLKDVKTRPELGKTLRNRLVSLMGSGSSVSTMAASFLYEVCDRSVDRLIKYTGFGNAAGLLVNQGLLAPGEAARRAVPDSDDSETDEYCEQKPNVNPVTGCIQMPAQNPLEGMTEEQKEYEAMKLVDALDKMTRMSEGIRPARIGPDGKLEPVEHVLQLQQRDSKGDAVENGEESD